MQSRALWAIAFVAWTAGVAFGLTTLWSYDNAPTAHTEIATAWPPQATVQQQPGRPTLVVMLHPQCSCSLATVAELARLMAGSNGALDAYALVLAPRSEPASWVRSTLWRAAAAIPGVHVVADTDGQDARRFGAIASGQTAIYGANGQLQFSGGITASRGHEGGNDGVNAVEAALHGAPTPHHSTFVFGCLLFNTDGGPGIADGAGE